MLSRVADSIYWMSRYIERAENVARFINVNLLLSLDMPAGLSEQWDPLVTTSGDREVFIKRYGKATRDNVLHFLTFDEENPNSILSCVRMARENARSIREIITQEMWESVNRFYLMVNESEADEGLPRDPHAFYNRVRDASHLFRGVTDSTLSHGESWRFARLGRLLERADKTSRILDVKYFILLPSPQDVGTPVDNLQWAALLRSASALHMYRRKYNRIAPERVAEFLILDRDFPRSIRHCVAKSEESLHEITGSPRQTFQNLAEQRMGRLRSELDYSNIQEIIAYGLHEYLDQFQTRLNAVGEAIFDTFFALHPVSGAVRTVAQRPQAPTKPVLTDSHASR